MIFDQTFIAIRQRNIFEIFDLSIHVIRTYFPALSLLLITNALPFFILDWLLFRWMTSEFFVSEYATIYLWTMLLMVTNQAQLGTTMITCYLGRALFQGRPSIRETIQASLKAMPQLFWIQGILRTVILAILVACAVGQSTSLTMLPLLMLTIVLGLIVRSFRPFANEMLLLEKNPLRKRKATDINYSSRSAALHKVAQPTIIGRFLLVALICLPLAFAFYSSMLLMDQTINLHIDPETTLITFYWPAALWLVAGLIAVVRFLSYIDIRIRQEGWAVELRIRAEAIRLNKRLGT